MASSRQTLDVDNLTFQTLFIRNTGVIQSGSGSGCGQSGFNVASNISSYTIPALPGTSSVTRQFEYLTPQQLFSVANIYITPSSIPGLQLSIDQLSTVEAQTIVQVSSISSIVGFQILGVVSTTNTIEQNINMTLYNSSYSTFYNIYSSVQLQNSTTAQTIIELNSLIVGISSLSTLVTSSFSTLGTYLDTEFNLAPTVSSISSYFFSYYNYLSESISSFSTNIGFALSTNYANDFSSLSSFTNTVNTIIGNSFGPGASTMSTTIIRGFSSLSSIITSYNPNVAMSSISTSIPTSLSSLSTLFDIQLGGRGISTISTNTSALYLSAITNAQLYAGIYGLSSLSTYVTSTTTYMTTNILNAAGDAERVSSLSTLVYNEVKMISDIVCTIGYIYIVIQQESVKVSLSTLSTSFGINYNNLTALSSFSTLLPTAYSSINSLFNTQSQTSTLSSLQYIQATNFTNFSTYMSSSYNDIFTGPGVSSLSSIIAPSVSSLSTTLNAVFSSFSNSVYDISSLRTDTGVSSISSFFGYSTLSMYSSYSTLLFCTITITNTNTNIVQNICTLRDYDANIYSTFSPTVSISTYQSSLFLLNSTISAVLVPLQNNSLSLSTIISSQTSSLFVSYGNVQSSFFSTLDVINLNYSFVSSFVVSSILNPTFSSFTARQITASNLIVTQQLNTSSFGINQSTTNEFPFSMVGNARILARPLPAVTHVLVGSNLSGKTIFTTSDVLSNYQSNSANQFATQGNAVAYNGEYWVAVGSNSPTSPSIKYTTKPSVNWENAGFTETPPETLISMNSVAWNGSYWIAGGGTAPVIYKSYNSVTWFPSDSGNTINTVLDVAWNGNRWVAVGTDTLGTYETICYSDDGENWINATGVGTTLFRYQANSVATNGRVWVAVGGPNETTTIKYGFTGSDWRDVTGISFAVAGYSVRWNGDMFVATGQNSNTSNILYSYTGSTWYYSVVGDSGTFISTKGTSVLWDGSKWRVTGINNSVTNTVGHLYSYDAVNWSTINLTTRAIYGQAFSSNTTPALQFSNFDIFSGEIPSFMNTRKRMNVIQSTIYFNDGDLTIRHLVSSLNIGHIGINTTYPEYALDIASGNARKPSGTTWLTPSDARVKQNIQEADLYSCAKLVQEIPFREFQFSKEFQAKTGVENDKVYGFIAQEVKKSIPNSVSYTNEYGYSDFHSLDTDQLFKIEFGATQYLLQKVKTLEAEVSTLESFVRLRSQV